MDKDGPIPLSGLDGEDTERPVLGLDEEPLTWCGGCGHHYHGKTCDESQCDCQNPAPQPWPYPWSGLDNHEPVQFKDSADFLAQAQENLRSIFSAASGRAEPYEASTRQARAERTRKSANHCPTCTCKKEK